MIIHDLGQLPKLDVGPVCTQKSVVQMNRSHAPCGLQISLLHGMHFELSFCEDEVHAPVLCSCKKHPDPAGGEHCL